jgi:hypothetical protein
VNQPATRGATRRMRKAGRPHSAARLNGAALVFAEVSVEFATGRRSTGRRAILIKRGAILAGGQARIIEGLIEAKTCVAGASLRTWYHTNHSQLPTRVSTCEGIGYLRGNIRLENAGLVQGRTTSSLHATKHCLRPHARRDLLQILSWLRRPRGPTGLLPGPRKPSHTLDISKL